MPGSKCQIVVLAGKTGHFTDIIKNKKRGGIERYVKKIRYIFPCHWIGKNRMVSYLERQKIY